MKAITDRICKKESGLVGGLRKVCRQRFEVEAADVGTTHINFRGYQHGRYTFDKADVGRQIEILSDGTNWTCWGFIQAQ